MYLSDTDILLALEAKKLTLSDFDEKRLGPASYDILLGNKFKIHQSHNIAYIDPQNKIVPEYHEIELADHEQFVLHPGVSILGISHDYFGSDEFLIQLSGKSSLARIGLIVHNTAGLINPGHYLNIVFELCNLNSIPIILRPKMPIAQLLFSPLSSVPRQSYHEIGRYGNGTENWASYIPHQQ